MKRLFSILALAALAFASQPATAADAATLYTRHCLSCHGVNRLGAMGPALLPESLERLKRKDADATIRDGRPATQMPAFGQILTGAEIEALVDWIHTPVSPAPTWSEADIRNSRIEHFPPGSLPDTRQGVVATADPMNLFIVVEAGDHHVSVLDGDRMARIHRFPSRYALHGGPKFSPDGRYVYFASRDGWISKFDIWNLQVIAEVRPGLPRTCRQHPGDERLRKTLRNALGRLRLAAGVIYRYFLNVAAAMHTATPSNAALGSRISSGFTLTGSAR